jgi:PAS domain S-box-containing protein
MDKKIKILIVEDNDVDAELIKNELEEEHILFEDYIVQTETNYLDGLRSFNPDIILSDFNLPTFNALKALSLLKESNIDVPFILVTGTQSEEIAVKCIKEGASDYILKSSLMRLPTAVIHALEKHKDKEAARDAEAAYKDLVENINDVIFSADSTGRIDYISPVIRMLTGYEPEELSGYKYRSIIHEDNKNLFENISGTAPEGKNKEIEFRGYSKEGELKWFKISTRAIYKRNKLTGYRGILSDITSKKNYEIELLKAKEKAEELIELKTSFLANISHELRTPMVGILGFSEMMENELAGPHIDVEGLNYMASTIRNSGKRFLDTLNLILEFTVLERGGEGLRLCWFNFPEMVKNIFVIHQAAAIKKGIKYNLLVTEETLDTYLDEKFCRSILNNLISNALKFTSTGGIVNVSVKVERNSNIDYVILMVQDNGIGIPSDKIPHIFEEFRQLSSGFSRNYDGTGLGLTITDKYVRRLNGSIKVESEIGAGSIFTVRLPVSYNLKFIKENVKNKEETKI